MTKAEELKLLEKIDALIKSADAGDYIPMTFAGIVDVCKRNIEDDFGDSPVHDLELERKLRCREIHEHEETKRMLADTQKALKEAQYENERVRKLADEWEKNAHDVGRLYAGLEGLEDQCAEKDAEIRKLKAEIVRLRLERMTDADMAKLYDTTKGEN